MPRSPRRIPRSRSTPSERIAQRDEALSLFEQNRPALLAAMRDAALAVYRTERRPVSANDVRHVLDAAVYDGDPRILGAVFHASRWLAVGYDRTNSLRAHDRAVRTFIPRAPMDRLPEHREWGAASATWSTSRVAGTTP
jgi:hypothetical protein